jgi:hypothetical protein
MLADTAAPAPGHVLVQPPQRPDMYLYSRPGARTCTCRCHPSHPFDVVDPQLQLMLNRIPVDTLRMRQLDASHYCECRLSRIRNQYS